MYPSFFPREGGLGKRDGVWVWGHLDPSAIVPEKEVIRGGGLPVISHRAFFVFLIPWGNTSFFRGMCDDLP